MDTKEFIEKANLVHNNFYNYEEAVYVLPKTKVKIICPVHGTFEQQATNHLQKRGCPSCNKTKKLTCEEFIEKASLIHGNFYNYKKAVYINSTTKLDIVCPIHGVFKQSPDKHLQGSGCLKCYRASRKLTTEQFIKKAKQKHQNKYDYSLVEYETSHVKVKIICPLHGIFEQKPNSHLRGKGCLDCSGKKRLSTEDFIKKSNKTHGYFYDYSLANYMNNSKKVKIICPVHGEFEQEPHSHLKGNGCGKCGKTKKLTREEFIEKANLVHDNFYDYSLFDFTNVRTKSMIRCPLHGTFKQDPHSHLKGTKCPSCSRGRSSEGQQNLFKIIKEKYPKIYSEYLIKNNENKYYVDIFMPGKNIIIEYYGDYWHCNPKKYKSNYWHPICKSYAKNIWARDRKREGELKKMGYKIIIIWENDFKNSNNILLKIDEKIGIHDI